ncbi:unnamed protein product [Chrysoparadoxa australica]
MEAFIGLEEGEEDEPAIVRRRRANIARNEAILAALDLDSPKVVVQARRNEKASRPRREAAPTQRVLRSQAPSGVKREMELEQLSRQRQQPRKVQRAKQESGEGENRDTAPGGTASKEHTQHRVRTMSDKALATRIKMVERAQGRYASLKMKLFAEVLREEGKLELAVLAEHALDRLAIGMGE